MQTYDLETAPLGLDEHEPQEEPEHVWVISRGRLTCDPTDFTGAFAKEEYAQAMLDIAPLGGFGLHVERISVLELLAVARKCGSPGVILFAEFPKEIRRWVL